jgi:hypothetical protein
LLRALVRGTGESVVAGGSHLRSSHGSRGKGERRVAIINFINKKERRTKEEENKEKGEEKVSLQDGTHVGWKYNDARDGRT